MYICGDRSGRESGRVWGFCRQSRVESAVGPSLLSPDQVIIIWQFRDQVMITLESMLTIDSHHSSDSTVLKSERCFWLWKDYIVQTKPTNLENIFEFFFFVNSTVLYLDHMLIFAPPLFHMDNYHMHLSYFVMLNDQCMYNVSWDSK